MTRLHQWQSLKVLRGTWALVLAKVCWVPTYLFSRSSNRQRLRGATQSSLKHMLHKLPTSVQKLDSLDHLSLLKMCIL